MKNNNTIKEFCISLRVYYEDTDVAGVVYHANYLKFMERGRTELLRSLGLDQSVLIDQDVAFAVIKVQLHYLQPARFNDFLEVSTQVIKQGRASVIFEQTVRSHSTPEIVYATAEIKVACVTMTTMKPRPLPEQIREEFARVS